MKFFLICFAVTLSLFTGSAHSANRGCPKSELKAVTSGFKGAFGVTHIVCQLPFAKATVYLEPRGSNDDSLALYKKNADGHWTMLDMGTGISCPIEGMPEDLCLRWLSEVKR